MTNEDFVSELLCGIDNEMMEGKKHSQAKPQPNGVTTLDTLFAKKRAGPWAFYRSYEG